MNSEPQITLPDSLPTMPTIATIPPNDWVIEIVPSNIGGTLDCAACKTSFTSMGRLALRRRSLHGYLCVRCWGNAPPEALAAFQTLLTPPPPPKSEPTPTLKPAHGFMVRVAAAIGWRTCGSCNASFWRPPTRAAIVRKSDAADLCPRCTAAAPQEFIEEVNAMQ